MKTPANVTSPASLVAAVWVALLAGAGLLAWIPWAWWQGRSAERTIPATRIQSVGRHAYSTHVWGLIKDSFHAMQPQAGHGLVSFFFNVPSDSGPPPGSTLELFEDGRPLGPSRSGDAEIAALGEGRYSHRDDVLTFAASDGSDPRSNGRRYVLRVSSRPRLAAAPIAVGALSWLAGLVFLARGAVRRREVVQFCAGPGSVDQASLRALLLVAVFTAYAFFWAALDVMALRWLVLLGLVSGLLLLVSRQAVRLDGWMTWCAAFLLVPALHIFASRDHPAPDVLARLAVSSILGLCILAVIRKGELGRPGVVPALLSVLSVGLALAVLLENTGFGLKDALADLGILGSVPWLVQVWNQKFHESWLLLLTWAAIAALSPRRPRQWVAAAAVAGVSLLAVLSGYSYTAKLAFPAGLLVFLASLRFGRLTRLAVAGGSLLVFLLGPLLVGIGWSLSKANLSRADQTQGFGMHLASRLICWEYTRARIAEKPLLGWGLGAGRKLPGTVKMASAVMPGEKELGPTLSQYVAFPGGHPHNLALLVWLETGAVGAILTAGLIWALFRRLGRVRGRVRGGALVAVATTLLLILSFNYPAWEAPVQLLAIVTLGLASSIASADGSPRPPAAETAVSTSTGEPVP